MNSMEQEALRRAQEMHSGARAVQRNQSKNSTHSQKVQTTNPSKEEERPCEEQKNEVQNLTATAYPLFADKEKLLILMLILILSSEDNSDPSLTLALLYLII